MHGLVECFLNLAVDQAIRVLHGGLADLLTKSHGAQTDGPHQQVTGAKFDFYHERDQVRKSPQSLAPGSSSRLEFKAKGVRDRQTELETIFIKEEQTSDRLAS
jgi:hypothetical protein